MHTQTYKQTQTHSHKNKPKHTHTYMCASNNIDTCKDMKIDLMKWSDGFKLRDTSVNTVNEMFQEFQTVLESAMNSHIPTKIISKRNQTPWISRRIKRLHKRKQRAFNSYNQHRDLASYETFSKQRNITYTETRNAHRSYISSICSDSPKRFWSYI